MALIPAVCENPECRVVFLNRSDYEIGEGSFIHMESTRQGPCPKCGGKWGLIPSGTYRQVGTDTVFTPLSEADSRLLLNALELVKRAVNTDMSPAAFQQEAQQQFPGLSALWRLMPGTKQEAYAFWMLLLAAITLFLTCRPQPPQQLLLPKEIIDAIHARPDTPGDTHIPPSPKSKPRPRRPKR